MQLLCTVCGLAILRRPFQQQSNIRNLKFSSSSESTLLQHYISTFVNVAGDSDVLPGGNYIPRHQ